MHLSSIAQAGGATAPSLALVPAGAPAALAVSDRPGVGRSLALHGLAIACFASIGLFPTLLPVVSIALVAACAVSSFALSMSGAQLGAGAAAIDPAAIASPELREAYLGVLRALDELERVLAAAPRSADALGPALARSRAAADACGRLATLGDPLQRYLAAHDPARLAEELARLRARAGETRDGGAAAALARAAASREAQLATCEQLAAQRDRIGARLDLVRAALEAFTAALVRRRAADEEQLLLDGEPPGERLDELGDELATLEAALDDDLPAPGLAAALEPDISA